MHVTVDNPIGETNVLVMRVGMPYTQKYGCAFHAYPKAQNDSTPAFDMTTADLTFRDYFEFQSFVLTVNRMATQLEDELHMQMVSRYEPLGICGRMRRPGNLGLSAVTCIIKLSFL